MEKNQGAGKNPKRVESSFTETHKPGSAARLRQRALENLKRERAGLKAVAGTSKNPPEESSSISTPDSHEVIRRTQEWRTEMERRKKERPWGIASISDLSGENEKS